MTPSKTDFRALGVDDDKLSPTHDAISAWLLRAVLQPGFAERLLSSTHRAPVSRRITYEGIELEVPIEREGRLVGFADARLNFAGSANLWVEIKTDDRAIGALVRQIKSYQKAGATGLWLAVLPEASDGAREFLAHAGVGFYIVPPVPEDLVSLSERRAKLPVDDFVAIPDA